MTEFVVVLLFDPETEKKLSDLQETLRLQGLTPEVGRNRPRPHITLANVKGITLAELTARLQNLMKNEVALDVRLDAVGTFPGDMGIVYIAPVVTGELLGLHKRFLDSLSGTGALPGDYYRHERWMPHCSMALNLTRAQIPIAVDLCRKSNVFGPARLVEVLVIDFPVTVELATYILGRQETLSNGHDGRNSARPD